MVIFSSPLSVELFLIGVLDNKQRKTTKNWGIGINSG